MLKETVAGNPIQVITLSQMISETLERINAKSNQSVEPTTLGRFLQLLTAGNVQIETSIG